MHKKFENCKKYKISHTFIDISCTNIQIRLTFFTIAGNETSALYECLLYRLSTNY